MAELGEREARVGDWREGRRGEDGEVGRPGRPGVGQGKDRTGDGDPDVFGLGDCEKKGCMKRFEGE